MDHLRRDVAACVDDAGIDAAAIFVVVHVHQFDLAAFDAPGEVSPRRFGSRRLGIAAGAQFRRIHAGDADPNFKLSPSQMAALASKVSPSITRSTWAETGPEKVLSESKA